MISNDDGKQLAASRDIASAIFVALHCLLGLALLTILIGIVPGYQRVFEDFDVELPVIARVVILLSRAAVSYWYLFVVMGAVALVIDYYVLRTFRRGAGRFAQSLWGALWLLVPLAVGAFFFVALTAPLTGLTESLQ